MPITSRIPSIAASLVLALSTLVAAPVATETTRGGPMRIPRDDPPDALAALDALGEARAFALASDESIAAAAFPHPDKPKRSVLRVASRSGVRPWELEVRGRLVALRFGPQGRNLYGIAHVGSRRGTTGAYLLVVDAISRKSHRSLSLPASASDLDVWRNERSLVIACRDEIRTVRVPEMHSGPLYRIAGENLSLASLPGRDRVLIGRMGEILLVDLSDPHGEREMPVRDRIGTPAPVVSLAASPKGTRALSLFRDGVSAMVTLDPLRLEDREPARAIAWPGTFLPAPRREVASKAEIVAAPDRPPRPVAARPDPREVERSPVEPAQPAPEATVAAPEAASPPERPTDIGAADRPEDGTPQEQPARASRPEPPEPSGEAVETSILDPARGSVRGTVTGDDPSLVAAVVFLGPNNLLREAARVPLRRDGTFEASGLQPGRYRLVLDGGGRVLVTEPPYLSLDVQAGVRATAGKIRIVRAI